jgi:plasmid replication initiation protein
MAKTKKTKLVVCESNQLIDASCELTLGEIRLLQLAITKIFRKEAVQEDKLYKIPVDEYAEQFGLSHKTAYEGLLDALVILKTRNIILKTKLIDPGASESRKSIISWVDRIDYMPETGEIELRWHRDIIPLLSAFSKETQYSKYYLENTCRMKSLHSIRLFRLLNKWRTAGKFKSDIPELKRLLGLAVDSYEVYDNFRSKVLEKGVKEVNELTDLQISFTRNPGKKAEWIEWVIDTKRKIAKEGRSYEGLGGEYEESLFGEE